MIMKGVWALRQRMVRSTSISILSLSKKLQKAAKHLLSIKTKFELFPVPRSLFAKRAFRHVLTLLVLRKQYESNSFQPEDPILSSCAAVCLFIKLCNYIN
jgi:hypothetical protein